jgi:hypothetical protein
MPNFTLPAVSGLFSTPAARGPARLRGQHPSRAAAPGRRAARPLVARPAPPPRLSTRQGLCAASNSAVDLTASLSGLKLTNLTALRAACAACPAGSVSVAGLKCMVCPPGTYADAAKASCRACARGYFSSGFGQAACKACPVGTFSPLPAAMACFKVRWLGRGGWVGGLGQMNVWMIAGEARGRRCQRARRAADADPSLTPLLGDRLPAPAPRPRSARPASRATAPPLRPATTWGSPPSNPATRCR